ncbi:MAG: hypothetical protein K0R54_724 [Clostridiaceae bacterium]|jgi:hypothetical protein|nr:hypothetical protein [Clostridiaceae bacterium]
MSKLEIFRDDTLLSLSFEDKKKVIKKINEMLSNMFFFRDLVEGDIVNKTNVWTNLGLNEGFHSDLSKMVGYDSILLNEKEKRHVEIREKNIEIRRLIDLLGKGVSPEAVTGAINRYENILRAWYESEGWHYASVSYSAYGIIADLSSDMSMEKEAHLADKEIFKVFKNNNGTKQKTDDGWDIHNAQFKSELLDTDNNKKRFQELLLSDFPNAVIYKFSGRKNDYNGFSLRIEFNIPYTDLENCYNQKLIS